MRYSKIITFTTCKTSSYNINLFTRNDNNEKCFIWIAFRSCNFTRFRLLELLPDRLVRGSNAHFSPNIISYMQEVLLIFQSLFLILSFSGGRHLPSCPEYGIPVESLRLTLPSSRGQNLLGVLNPCTDIPVGPSSTIFWVAAFQLMVISFPFLKFARISKC